MTGAEHYKEAERILRAAGSAPSDLDVTQNLAAAQVHATLALTAATAMPAEQRYYGPDSGTDREWSAVIA